MRRYYFKRGGKKVYSVPNTIDAIENKARQEADALGRSVVVFYEDIEGGLRKAGKAAKKVYARNPATKRQGKAAWIAEVRGKVGKLSRPGRNHAEFLYEQGKASTTGAANLIKTWQAEGFYPGSPYDY